ncbi:hypothetical protein GW17_00018997 [Ensete ventricosum]|nr:hypothetical protein GW17_00018997 [Ensete ventricosum]
MIIIFSKGCPSPLPYPHCTVALRKRRRCTQSAWAAAPTLGAAALGRHLAGERCRLARVLPLQERPPLQAAALLAGLPLVASQRAAAPCGLAAGAAYARRRRPFMRQPCPRATAHAGGCPCKGLWPQPAAPCSWPGRGWEIVYPCIPDPDGEDEGGQASSSLAVSTRWISAGKLLQSDLATLAQREGGE